jgi:hypothetical protein
LRAYRLIRELSIGRIGPFKLPRLIDSEDEGRLIEMSIVSAPYFLDLASTHDELEMARLDFSDEVCAEREQHWQELFGEDWASVRNARDSLLELTGLMYLDLSPKNIRVR